eukprot:6082427-Prymnesium_polylepis.1
MGALASVGGTPNALELYSPGGIYEGVFEFNSVWEAANLDLPGNRISSLTFNATPPADVLAGRLPYVLAKYDPTTYPDRSHLGIQPSDNDGGFN